MKATYIGSFHSLNERHERLINRFIASDKQLRPSSVWELLPGKNTFGCDAFVTLEDGIRYPVEFKTLAGASSGGSPYPTFCVEMFADYEQTKRTEWRDHASFIIFINIYEGAAYIYDAVELDAWASSQKLRPSGTGTGQFGKKNEDKLCSWVVCSKWINEDAGFLERVELN